MAAETYRFSYDELAKPLDEVQKVHNDTLADMANLSENSDVLNMYLDPNRDTVSYNMYNNFKRELDSNVNDFAKHGLTRNNGSRLLALHRNYNNNIKNILSAVEAREKEIAEQHKIQQDAKGQAVFSKDADYTSIDDYLQGNKGYNQNNLDEIRDEAKTFASAASERHVNSDLTQKVFNGMYYQQLQQVGYNYKEAYGILKRLSNKFVNDFKYNPQYTEEEKEEHLGFINRMWEALEARNIDKFSSEDQGRMIKSYLDGIDAGLKYKEDRHFYETEDLAKLKRSNTNLKVITGGNDKLPDDETPMSYNHTDVTQDFENDKDRQENILKFMTGESDPSWYSGIFGYKSGYKLMIANTGKVDDNGKPLHRLATFSDYLSNCGYYKDNKGNWLKKINDKSSKYATNDEINKAKQNYYELLNHIKDEFHFEDHDIKAAQKPIAEGEYLENMFTDQIAINEEDAKPKAIISYVIPSNFSDRGNLIGQMINLAGSSPARTGLSINSKTGIYKFSGKIDMKAVDTSKLKDAIISMVYAPQVKDDQHPIYVEIRHRDINDGNPVYYPLDKFSNESGALEAETLWGLANNNLETIRRNAEILGLNIEGLTEEKVRRYMTKARESKDPNTRKSMLDSLSQIYRALKYINYFNKAGIKVAANRAASDITYQKITLSEKDKEDKDNKTNNKTTNK